MQFITNHWASSILSVQPHEIPRIPGWKYEDGSYDVNWFRGEATPRSLKLIFVEGTARCDETTDQV